VRLVSKWRTILFEAEMEEAKALAMLEALGLDREQTCRFNGSSHSRDTDRTWPWRSCSWCRGMGGGIVGHFHLHSPFAGFSFMAARCWSFSSGSFHRRSRLGRRILTRWLWEEIPPDGSRSHTSIQRAIG